MAITDEETELSDLLNRMTLTEPLIYFMNERKNQHEWAPYTPFTLTIENPEQVWDFIRGRLIWTVLLDVPVLRNALAREGYKVSWTSGDDYPLKVENTATGGVGGISQHLIDRVAYECVSPRWIADIHMAAMTRQEHEIAKAKP